MIFAHYSATPLLPRNHSPSGNRRLLWCCSHRRLHHPINQSSPISFQELNSLLPSGSPALILRSPSKPLLAATATQTPIFCSKSEASLHLVQFGSFSRW